MTCVHLTYECVQLLKSMLTKNSSQRPSAEECLKNPWFSKDHESLINLIELNKQTSMFNTLHSGNSSCMQQKTNTQDFMSFVISPNYFQNLINTSHANPEANQCSSISGFFGAVNQ